GRERRGEKGGTVVCGCHKSLAPGSGSNRRGGRGDGGHRCYESLTLRECKGGWAGQGPATRIPQGERNGLEIGVVARREL
ncbi:hypothetical protein JTE90_021130, partial [Oedothorax gibbosus]